MARRPTRIQGFTYRGCHRYFVTTYTLCVMPDHVHILPEGMSDDADFRNAVRVWKLRTGYAWRMKHQTALWQIGYWERVLREKDDARAVIRYMLENPARRTGGAVR
ncbi:MAG TPA: transposase [Vicinamibacterales bacterium]|jgi:REP element-mobilizing transposase RayT|nr:transposase [Vicinamibacterales bacterium]